MMKQEDKQLLLADLCGRLPYGVHLFTNSKHHIRLLTISNDIDYNEQYWVNGLYDIDEVKPYLRPMSSMTEEEQKEFVQFHCVKLCPIIIDDMLTLGNESKMFDWLDAHHFDYRGLIPKGLALKAHDGMYNNKEKQQ